MSGKRLVLEEFHLGFHVAASLPAAEADAMTRVLASAGFRRRLRQVLARLVREFPTLARATVRVTR